MKSIISFLLMLCITISFAAHALADNNIENPASTQPKTEAADAKIAQPAENTAAANSESSAQVDPAQPKPAENAAEASASNGAAAAAEPEKAAAATEKTPDILPDETDLDFLGGLNSLLDPDNNSLEQKSNSILQKYANNPIVRFFQKLIDAVAGFLENLFALATKAAKVGES